MISFRMDGWMDGWIEGGVGYYGLLANCGWYTKDGSISDQ